MPGSSDADKELDEPDLPTAPMGHPLQISRRVSEEVMMLPKALETISFVSLLEDMQQGEPRDQFFQTLALESKSIIGKTVGSEGNEDGLCTVPAQPLEHWRGAEEPLSTLAQFA